MFKVSAACLTWACALNSFALANDVSNSSQSVVTDKNWSFVFRPFAYSPFLSADLDVGDLSVDYSGTNFISIVNFFAQGDFELHYDRYYLYGEINYYDVSDDTTIDPRSGLPGDPVSGDGYFTMNGCTCTVALGYEMDPIRDTAWSLYSGARFWNFKTKLRLNAQGPLGADLSEETTINFVDPIIGFKANYPLSEHAELRFRSDIGGFTVGSDFQNDAIIEYGYRISPSMTALLGFRSFYVTGSDSGGSVDYNAWYYGPQLSLEFVF